MPAPEEVWALARAAGSLDGAIFLTAAFTGLRMGELLALHWRDVDFSGSVIRVRSSWAGGQLTTPKSGKARSVPMAPDVAAVLAKLGDRWHWIGDDDLRDPSYFRQVTVDPELRTVVWPNGLDPAPELLHRHLSAGAATVSSAA